MTTESRNAVLYIVPCSLLVLPRYRTIVVCQTDSYKLFSTNIPCIIASNAVIICSQSVDGLKIFFKSNVTQRPLLIRIFPQCLFGRPVSPQALYLKWSVWLYNYWKIKVFIVQFSSYFFIIFSCFSIRTHLTFAYVLLLQLNKLYLYGCYLLKLYLFIYIFNFFCFLFCLKFLFLSIFREFFISYFSLICFTLLLVCHLLYNIHT